MPGEYQILIKPGDGEYEEKRSRFLATATPIRSEEEAAAFLAARRKKYWDARHCCYAYVLGTKNELCRFSDDGEPSGTAGKPILDVVLGSGIRNQLIAVTRYFGGTLLGTGGLVRAYSTAAKAALSAALPATVYVGEEWQLICDYADLSRIDKAAEAQGLLTGDRQFGSDVTLTYYLLEGQAPAFLAAAADATGGSAIAEKIRDLSFLAEGGKVIPGDPV